jgi:hypothetical protein
MLQGTRGTPNAVIHILFFLFDPHNSSEKLISLNLIIPNLWIRKLRPRKAVRDHRVRGYPSSKSWLILRGYAASPKKLHFSENLTHFLCDALTVGTYHVPPFCLGCQEAQTKFDIEEVIIAPQVPDRMASAFLSLVSDLSCSIFNCCHVCFGRSYLKFPLNCK